MNFNSIIGNTKVKTYLDNSIDHQNILHSYLFLGTSGIGKLLIAKEFARKILCKDEHKDGCTCKACLCMEGKNHPDFYLINEDGVTIKIDQVRELTEKMYEKPIMSDKKVYIFNDFDKMTAEGQNCLLKTLEEPPEFVVIILISSNDNLIINTIKSRCMSVKFKNLSDEELLKYTKENLNYDNINKNLLKSFDGSIGKAIIQQDFKEKFEEVDKLISSLNSKDIIDVFLEGRVIYDKDNIFEILDYIIICLYSKKEENERYLDCIKYVNECAMRLKGYSNFDMSIDNLLLKMWEELNENCNRC